MTLAQSIPALASGQATDLVSQITGAQWAILGFLALFLALVIAKKLAKAALVLAILVGLGVLAFHGNSQGWFT